MTFQEFWTEFTKTVGEPDIYDVFGVGVSGYQEYFAQLGQQFKAATAGTLSANAALKLGTDFVSMANRMELIANRLNALPLPSLDEASRAIKGRLNEIILDMKFWGRQVSAAASSGDVALLSRTAGSAFAQLGAALALYQVGESIYTAGGATNPSATANAMAQKSVGIFAGVWLGAKTGATAGFLAGLATANPVVVAAASVLGAMVGGYYGGKLGEGAWNVAYKEYLDKLPGIIDVGVSGRAYVVAWAGRAQGLLGVFDGTWLTSNQLPIEDKVLLTSIFATLHGVPVSDAMDADIKRLLEAPFDGSVLISIQK